MIQIKHTGEYFDLTPTKSGYIQSLILIRDYSSDDNDRIWAHNELNHIARLERKQGGK